MLEAPPRATFAMPTARPQPPSPAERLRPRRDPAALAPAAARSGAVVVGFVGGVGSGKSTVVDELAEILHAERRDALIIDGDTVGHEVRDQPEVVEQIVHRFGGEVRGPDGLIDRQALGLRVFGQGEQTDPDVLRQNLDALNGIMHPAMRAEFESRVAATPAELVLFDAAILLEAGWDDLCHEIVLVEVDALTRQQRVAARGWSPEQWQARENSQWPIDRKRAAATLAVLNQSPNATPEDAAAAVLDALDRVGSTATY